MAKEAEGTVFEAALQATTRTKWVNENYGMRLAS